MLEVLALRGVLRSQLLTTDDSFQFNKVVARLKEAVAGLPEEPATLPESEGVSEPGIAALLEADAKGAVIAAEVLEGVRRGHLLDCLEAGRVVYRWAGGKDQVGNLRSRIDDLSTMAHLPVLSHHFGAQCLGHTISPPQFQDIHPPPPPYNPHRLPWARTSVDLLVDHFRQHVRRFLPAEQDRVAAMIVFVKEQRAARRQVGEGLAGGRRCWDRAPHGGPSMHWLDLPAS